MPGEVAIHQSTSSAVLAARPYARMLSQFLNKDLNKARQLASLSRIGFLLDDNQAAIEALDHAMRRLRAVNQSILKSTCAMLGNLAIPESTSAAVLAMKPCSRLVSLLRDTDLNVCSSAVYALSKISFSKAGAQDAVDANVLERAMDFLSSPHARTRKRTCEMLGRLLAHETTTNVVLDLHLSSKLVLLLRDRDHAVRESAVVALAETCRSSVGINHVLATDIMEHIPAMVLSREFLMRQYGCLILIHMARYKRPLHCTEPLSTEQQMTEGPALDPNQASPRNHNTFVWELVLNKLGVNISELRPSSVDGNVTPRNVFVFSWNYANGSNLKLLGNFYFRQHMIQPRGFSFSGVTLGKRG
ncbi:armadillo-type protein [Mycena pura]|uniref:Armadillo-type protein n=1 Tax=Mycena pura TaxID=153505 RepID=A0AAD6YLX7_9AGAR|nr:armadillo-type protein [Mycena pura]